MLNNRLDLKGTIKLDVITIGDKHFMNTLKPCLKLFIFTLLISILHSCGIDTNVAKIAKDDDALQASCYHPNSESFEKNKSISLTCTDKLGPCQIAVCKDSRYDEYAIAETYERYIANYGGKLIEDSRLCKTLKTNDLRCDHPLATNHNENAKCIFEVCPDSSFFEYQLKLDFEAYLNKYGAERGEIVVNSNLCKSKIQIACCSHPEGLNYFDKSTISASCDFEACTEKEKENYNSSKVTEYENYIKLYGGKITNTPNTCGITVIPGCTNAKASNFNSSANKENGTCNFKGCLNESSSSYSSELNNSINEYKASLVLKNITYTGFIDSNFGCKFNGCKQSLATNFNPLATDENGSCLWQGCIDPSYIEYSENLKNAYNAYKILYPSSSLVNTCSSKNFSKTTRSIHYDTQNVDLKLSLVIDTSLSMENIIEKVKNALTNPLQSLKTQNGSITIDLHDLAKIEGTAKAYDYFDENNQNIEAPACAAGSPYLHCGGATQTWTPASWRTRYPKAPFPVHSFVITAQSSDEEIANQVQLGMSKIIINPNLNKEKGICYIYRLTRDNFLSSSKNVFAIISDENDDSTDCIQKQDNIISSGYYHVSSPTSSTQRIVSYKFLVNNEIFQGTVFNNSSTSTTCDQSDLNLIYNAVGSTNAIQITCTVGFYQNNGWMALLYKSQLSFNFYNNYPENLCNTSFVFEGVTYTDLKHYVHEKLYPSKPAETMNCAKVGPQPEIQTTYLQLSYMPTDGINKIIAQLNKNISWSRQNYAYGSIIFNSSNHACAPDEALNKVNGAKYISLHNNLVNTTNKVISKVGDICAANYETLLNDIIFNTFKKILTYRYLVAEKINITVAVVYLIDASGNKQLVASSNYTVKEESNKTYIEFVEGYTDTVLEAKDVEINYYDN